MIVLDSIDELLTHNQGVQADVIELSAESFMKMSSVIEIMRLRLMKTSQQLQYQDIISQQLNATREAIESMKNSIDIFSHANKNQEGLAENSLLKLREKLNATLEDAKDKKSRFFGKIAEDYVNDEIDFF
ncbi:hypothetical protein [Sulfurimonas sp.]|jgi:hypothetical protein|uniref:hypothetical protein n=1 Tax=Sulfurimonas sp. TaxID=2022749 RepID=UPI0025D9DD38|nr:hypothetical protein [Sulfurimonas sp.]MBT5935487.1 hypothetical protein [Sulfurimonas sp.]